MRSRVQSGNLRPRIERTYPMAKSDAESFDQARKLDWLNPVAMATLKDAVLNKKAKRVFLNGQEFTIDYDQNFRMEYTDDVRCVLVKPVTGFAPMGYISLSRLEKFDFETADD